MTELTLKFEAYLYRPDGSKIGNVRAVYDEDVGPCIKWKCMEKEVELERVEIVLGTKGVGARTYNITFKKDQTLIIPLDV